MQMLLSSLKVQQFLAIINTWTVKQYVFLLFRTWYVCALMDTGLEDTCYQVSLFITTKLFMPPG